MMSHVTFPGELRVVDDVVQAFCDLFRSSGARSVALSGGGTARDCYEELAVRARDWSAISVFFGDERMVPVEHPDSNEGMARQVLLDHVHPAAIHSMVAAGTDGYDAIIRAEPPIDFIHLGLGPDGHTASLFPGSPALAERERFVVETGDDLHPHRRLTFTVPAIERGVLVVVTVAGAEKREALDRVQRGEDVPATRIRAQRVIWLVDEAAAPDAPRSDA